MDGPVSINIQCPYLIPMSLTKLVIDVVKSLLILVALIKVCVTMTLEREIYFV